MKTKNEYIQLLHSSDKLLSQQFGVRSLRLFGSVARDEHTSASDVDICVETETPNPFLIMDLKEYLENLFGCSVDIVRFRENMNPYLKERIEKEGIYVLQ
ncbi:MAG TPA: nucleotidyltransferase family protein [Petrimonas sp.]|uniref:nucleotidyltransferase family protein n=1 Tax=Petrimonas sp. TaxID=2023866 RepID=UPI00095C93F2|nr:nucleotidyltransferase family protein [Petrimonas sp.]OJV34932.1 MAG: DNA polymerase subunit beta [Bacteroidia bacterium 43-41]MEA4948979.1 nucleotidyltransferase family protein [Petrimonas sp.]MEA4980198.1 nucleotidyltransferase family protein [Petrimonas sp.]MEA5046263.1 nucleotidyltransferase family protein [Petrimonas sp.]